MHHNQVEDLLWHVFRSECVILGEDNVIAILKGRSTPVELRGGANASVYEVFIQMAAVISLIDASWSLIDRLRGPQPPNAEQLAAEENLRTLALQAKLSELRQRELYKKMIALWQESGNK